MLIISILPHFNAVFLDFYFTLLFTNELTTIVMNEKEYSSGVRLLRILRAIVERPYCYTKKHWANQYQVSGDTVKRDFDVMRNAGFELDIDSKYRYALQADKPYESLKELLLFSEAEAAFLEKLLDNEQEDTKMKERMQRKLISIYEMSRMGNSIITKPFLNNVNLLSQAKEGKRRVNLVRYHSTNSSSVKDRIVEPFHVAIEEDILHAFDADKKEIRHYRISRIIRVALLNEAWQHEGKHSIKATDAFRIVDDNQVYVHIVLTVGGYNELTERYPLTKSYITPSPEKSDAFLFTGKVNHRFYGLSNFILGFHGYVAEICEPMALIEHIRAEIKKINF